MARGVEASAGIRLEASPGQKQSLATPAAAETVSSMMLVTISPFLLFARVNMENGRRIQFSGQLFYFIRKRIKKIKYIFF